MTKAEAEVLAVIISEVDGGCSVCIESACASLNKHAMLFGWLFTFDSHKRPRDDDSEKDDYAMSVVRVSQAP